MQVKDVNRSRRSIGVLAVACLVLQLAVVPNISLGGGRANAAFVFAALVALTIGGRTGVACGFVAGLVFDLSTTGPIGLMALLLTTVSYVLGVEVRDRLADGSIAGSFMPAVVGAVAVSIAYHLVMLFLGRSDSLVDVLVLRSLPTALLTIALYLPLAFVLVRHGASSGLRGSRGHHVGRYDIDGR